MKTAFKSSAELDDMIKRSRNPKKRRAIRRVLYGRWKHTLKPIGEASARHPLESVNFGGPL
jgi:hypothetical protein